METKTVLVRICAGTHCYLMGGAELQLFSEYLPAHLKDQVIITGSPCLGICDAEDGCKPPFVLVNDRKVQQANIQSLLEVVKNELEK
ncbi:MAG: (2Fe-2S) ferredoxin domain-containing protein [Bacteroidales bacterium]